MKGLAILDAGFLWNPGVPLLERKNRGRAGAEREDRVASSVGRGKGCRVGDVVCYRCLAHRIVVALRLLAEWCIDQELHIAIQHHVDAIRATLVNFEHSLDGDAAPAQMLRRPASREQLESHFLKPSRDRCN